MRALLLLVLLAGCRSTTSGGDVPDAATSTSSSSTGGAMPVNESAPCESCTAPVAVGALASAELNETSGTGASRRHPGVFYLHNDSGDTARFFAIDARGADLGRYVVTGAQAIDWEDMAVAPCGDASCLYLADIGDNFARRTSCVIYRVPEPETVAPGEQAVEGDALPFRYPDGSHDAETLLGDPTTGQLWIVSKVKSGASGVYRFPATLTAGVEVVLEKVGSVAAPSGSPSFTAGDVHPAGAGVLLRTYSHAWFFPGAAIGDALAGAPCSLPVATEPQGETIGWTVAGDGFLTVSEGDKPPIHRASCVR